MTDLDEAMREARDWLTDLHPQFANDETARFARALLALHVENERLRAVATCAADIVESCAKRHGHDSSITADALRIRLSRWANDFEAALIRAALTSRSPK